MAMAAKTQFNVLISVCVENNEMEDIIKAKQLFEQAAKQSSRNKCLEEGIFKNFGTCRGICVFITQTDVVAYLYMGLMGIFIRKVASRGSVTTAIFGTKWTNNNFLFRQI